MDEVCWVKEIVAPVIEEGLKRFEYNISVHTGYKLPNAYEISSYNGMSPDYPQSIDCETDLLIVENYEGDKRIPRVVAEVKNNCRITPHDAIAYSHKAMTHRQVYPS